MTTATTVKAISAAAIIALTTAMGSTAFAHDITNAGKDVYAAPEQINVSKSNAKNLVNELLKREYDHSGYEARAIRKEGDQWRVLIKDRTRTVARAYVDSKTGNIHID